MDAFQLNLILEQFLPRVCTLRYRCRNVHRGGNGRCRQVFAWACGQRPKRFHHHHPLRKARLSRYVDRFNIHDNKTIEMKNLSWRLNSNHYHFQFKPLIAEELAHSQLSQSPFFSRAHHINIILIVFDSSIWNSGPMFDFSSPQPAVLGVGGNVLCMFTVLWIQFPPSFKTIWLYHLCVCYLDQPFGKHKPPILSRPVHLWVHDMSRPKAFCILKISSS